MSEHGGTTLLRPCGHTGSHCVCVLLFQGTAAFQCGVEGGVRFRGDRCLQSMIIESKIVEVGVHDGSRHRSPDSMLLLPPSDTAAAQCGGATEKDAANHGGRE